MSALSRRLALAREPLFLHFEVMLRERLTIMDALPSGEKGLATPGSLLWRKGGEREESPWNAVAGP